MQFITNKIITGKSKSFEDIVAEYRSKGEAVKIAASQATIKTANEEEAESSGQLDVEPLHQTGESTTMPKNGPNAKKEDGKASSSATDPEEDGKDSGQPKAEGSEKFTNDPEAPSEEEKSGTSDVDTKEAGIKGTCKKCSKPNFLCECDKNDTEKDEKDGNDTEDKNDEKDEDTKEAAVKCKECDCDPCECKKSKCAETKSASTKFVKVANLDDKSKSWLREYWKELYPPEFVEAMLADK